MIHPPYPIYIRKHGSRHHAVVLLVALLISLLTPISAMAEIVIGGNVYGGGNEGDVDGSTKVTVLQGTLEGNVYGGGNIADLSEHTTVTLRGGFIKGSVFGGARMANIEGHTFVHVDGENQTDTLVVKNVYGGNDIAGTIGTLNEGTLDFVPKVESLKTGTFDKREFNAFVYTTGNKYADLPYVIGSLYGGGNGAYDYIEVDDGEYKYKVNVDDTEYTISHKPELDNTYIEIGGGFFGHVFGGGNNVTVKENTVIYAENKTAFNGLANRVCFEHAQIVGLDDKHYRVEEHNGHKDIYFDHHIAGLFGGNNLADMDIRPTWYLRKSRINNLYAGGNKGRMTHPNGIILPLRSDSLRVNNVYGGCRMADVAPNDMMAPVADTISTWDFVKKKMDAYAFKEGYASRVFITGGHYNNVYGGNDISGKVHYGCNVELHGGRMVNVYGGGNGSYAYTDNPQWVKDHPEDADYYYSVPEGSTSLQALHKHRPHAKNTLIYITGYEHDNPLVVAGEVYCGGNSATLADEEGLRVNANATLRIGKHAIIDGVFLGSNGANMVTEEMFEKYANDDFSSIDLTTVEGMKSYLGSVAVYTRPRLKWDEDIDETYIGSLHYGGNKGSMTYSGMSTINVPREIVIYEKVVGGCNDACVKEGTYNAEYHGGLLEKGEPYNGMDNVKICLNVDAYFRPMELKLSYMDNNLFVENCEFLPDLLEEKIIETYDNQTLTSQTFVDANIYGGCYNSGHVKGDVVININKPLIHPKVFELRKEILHATAEDVYGSALAVYGGGYGELAIVEGNTQVNLTDSASVLLVFGGGEMGVVEGNTEVNFAHNMVLPTDDAHSIAHNVNVYKAYAAGYEGDVKGNATLNLRGGGVFRGFAGACNADVLGTTTAIVGWRDEEGDEYNYGLPYVANAVFGGNDFGGEVMGDTLRSIQVRDYFGNELESLQVRSQSYVQYLSGNIGKALYGGSYGSYDYSRTDIYNTDPEKGFKDPRFMDEVVDDDDNVIATNTFVHIASKSRDEQDLIGSATHKDPTIITGIVGGGRGYRNQPGHVEVNQTYVLLNGTDYTQRSNATPMAYRVYGGGNLSMVHNARVDAYSGTVKRIFGGTHGVKTVELVDTVPYNVGNTLINYYASMIYPLTDIFGAGANSGSKKSTINLYGGNVNNVHGGAYTEGYTWSSEINVPEESTIHANAIFGGGLGEEEGRPCDVNVATINYMSKKEATVEQGLFGGNNTARVTKESHIYVSAPVRNRNGVLQSVYGAGYGNATVAGFTHINLMPGAHVAKVYGGGKEGRVYNHYKYYLAGDEAIKDYYDKGYGHNACWMSDTIKLSNTLIEVEQGAVVENNVFGGGEGTAAFVSGKTKVQLLGGLVKGDIYGGGDAGAMPRMTGEMNGYMNSATQTVETLCDIQGGQVRKVFGGGLNGNIDGDTRVVIGTEAGESFASGVPAILRNVYGGSERAMVTGTAQVDMYNGYIGYEYVELTDAEVQIGSEGADEPEEQELQLAAGMSREGEAKQMVYEPLLDLDGNDEYLEFEEEGNIYGAGYGEGAVVVHTQVNLHGGTVRNSLYGGGEIAAVGQGIVAASHDYADISNPGTTLVRMYGGLVEGDIFGGGRGYTYTYTYTGEDSPYKTVREYTDGYVFGKTAVEIYRGTIGTDETVAKGKGNVFGGGNIGYVYSVGRKHTTDLPVSEEEVEEDAVMANGKRNVTSNKFGDKIIGHYYYKGDDANTTDRVETTADRTEDCRVLIQPLEHDEEGITIRNAIFAGGNVSSGSDIVYANAVTVFGNVTASVVDLYDEDLVKIGGEHKGGLYGDGNLTFVDGYRELNLTNYGTDYYHLQDKKNITADDYKQLADHDKEYYESIEGGYKLREGRILNTIQRADFCGIFGSRIMLYGAQDRVPDQVDYTNYAINRVGEVSLNHKDGRGNYLGIYNVAKFFGALTSDVEFSDPHRINEINTAADSRTYYEYKQDNLGDVSRNKGTSSNIVSQASGTYLELVKELDEDGNKVYGYVTGVIELDLIGMNEGEGGGYVYAKKEYGIQNEISPEAKKHLTLSAANQGAVTSASFTYQDPKEGATMQTSGNFVHSGRTILDEDYSADGHYWYVRGNVYNHDIIISAYAGSAQTFSNSVSIPLAISNSKLRLDEIKTNITELNENEISNANGYVLNFAMNNPTAWNKLEPTFKCSTGGVYGQREYAVNNLISKTIFDKNEVGTAEFEPAYITIQDYYNGTTYLLHGSYISQTEYNKLAEETQLNYFEEAYICVNTLKKDDKEYALLGELISKSEYDNLDEKSKEHFQLAYVCTEEGKYGGKAFVKDQDYPASDYINLSADERLNFEYNVESAFDLLYSQYTETSFYTEEKTVESEPLPIIATAALYVPRESDITKLSKDRTVTAVYKHNYSEGDKVNTETHNVNIHIQFRSGQPVIGQLNTPSTVLPNSTIGLPVPTVTPGAYEVLGSGWEIYRTEGDANTHLNGTPYVNNATPMYWYQNGYYVAYYTKTYLGRSYSNPVKLSVANYHRMGEVMSHMVDGKHEYMYIDYADVERAAKIYIDSVAYASTSIAADSIHKNDLDFLQDLYAASLMSDSLDTYVSGCNNLDIILRSDIAPKQYTDWQAIGTAENCFAGTLHGNGYTISGLNNSLFGRLCGSVYNLGVTGTFTGGGVADNGGDPSDGYAENCWVYTSSTPTAKAVIGEGGTIRNSYYRTDNHFEKGNAIAASQAAFEMGEVAYLLNGFYLDKRYRNNNDNGDDNDDLKYVEKYYADGDFRYANGKIPMTADERYSEKNGQGKYTPIYPDDYIYFGQRITYALTEKEANDRGLDLHDSLPRRIAKNDIDGQIRVVRSHGNRVYRAPAYKQSKNIDKIYFNSYAHFVDSCKNMPIHHNVTAIDLTGYNDNNYTDAEGGYRPYLDYEGIEHYTMSGLTSNLLIYADSVNDAASYALLEKLYVPVLVFGKNDGDKYVNAYNELSVQGNLGQVHGHLVDLVVDGEGNRSYLAKRHQILVDREDFNAPIGYTFDEGCYMWYQRQPERYAETDKPGWESLYLPFTADFTTTQDKGQITYFYGDSTTNNEFWLREFEEVTTGEGTTTALFDRLDAVEGQSIVVANKFLYDYYYNGNDANGDRYQQYYAQQTRTKKGYPYIEAYTPYIVAFPGKSYYEFDMSGQFDPDGAEGPIKKLNPQVVTFVSVDKAEIDVTDDALESLNTNYMGALTHRTLNGDYVLNAEGSAFQNESGSIVPFRAYMTTPASGAPRRILIGNVTEEEEPIEDIANRGLTIYGKKEAVYIESTLEYEAMVTIYSLSGQVVSRVKVMPMSKEVVTMPSRGVYIANNRKVAVL